MTKTIGISIIIGGYISILFAVFLTGFFGENIFANFLAGWGYIAMTPGILIFIFGKKN